MTCANAVMGVLDHRAVRRVHAHALGGLEEDIRCGLAVLDIISAGDGCKGIAQAKTLQTHQRLFPIRRRGQRKRKARRLELVERLARTRHQREVGLRELVKMHVVQANGLVCGIDAAAQALR